MSNNPARPKSKTFVAVLHPLAAKLNLKPHLSDVTLANILSGDTCAPISLADFEKYLTFIEFSVENLQFLVWFQDYRERFFNLPCQGHGPGRNDFVFASPSRAETERRAAESLAKLANNLSLDEGAQPGMQQSGLATSGTAAITPVLQLPTLPPVSVPPASSSLRYTATSYPPTPCTISSTNHVEDHLLRAECTRVLATFLSPGAAKELPLDAIVRDTVIRNLTSNSHPDIFLPVYEEIYTLLERTSLPRFLSCASANINLPKQVYWYSTGILNFTIGLAIAISLIMTLPTPPESNRAWRSFAVGFIALGSVQCYSAWRGYCSQLWMRGSTQLRVWEMQEMDEEAQAFVDRILGSSLPKKRRVRDEPHREKDGPVVSGTPPASYPGEGVAAIAPFTVESRGHPGHSSDSVISYGFATTHNFRRPPIFGPETVVQDPRIKAVHRRLMGEILHFGFWCIVAFSAIMFSVPSRLHA